MYAAILVDLDDTLLDDRAAMSAAVLKFRRKQALLPDEEDATIAARWDAVGRSLWRRLARGEVGFAEQRRLRLREVFSLALSDDEADSLFADYLLFYEQGWALMPGAQEFLDATSHLPRAIVTNGHQSQALKKIATLGLMGHFQAVVTPEDCGARKPDPRMFLHALKLLGVDSGDALMVGDSHDADIAPAAALGMHVFHVNPNEAGRSIRYAARRA